MELSDKQKVKVYEKEGYVICEIGKKHEVCFGIKLMFENIDLINTYNLHILDCCPKCKKKVYNQRRKIKKKKH